jgi:hypothetical protein
MFRYIMARTCYIRWNNILCTRSSRLTFFYSVTCISLKQYSAGIHVTPLGHNILILSAFALTLLCCMLSGEATNTNLVVFGLTQPELEPTICRTRGKLNNYMYYTINLLLSMAPRKDHAKSRKSDLPNVINSLNILLHDVFRVKINVYSKTSVYLCYFCYYTQIKIKLVTFFFY